MLYNWSSKIVNQKQTLFTTSDYIVHNGFPIDSNSVDGASANLVGRILSNEKSIVPVTTRPAFDTTNVSDLPGSGNRYIAKVQSPLVITKSVTQTIVSGVGSSVQYSTNPVAHNFAVGDQVVVSGITTAQGSTAGNTVTINSATTYTFSASDVTGIVDGTYSGLSGTATVIYSSSSPFNPFDLVPSQGAVRSLYSWSGTSSTIGYSDFTSVTYPDLLDGISSHNNSGNAAKLALTTPDNNRSALTQVPSFSLAKNQFFVTNYNPFKINLTSLNTFTTLVVGYFDRVSDNVVNSTSTGYDNNFYGIFSETTVTRDGQVNTNIYTITAQNHTDPLLSVRYLKDGTITLNLGDRVLTSIKSSGRLNKPMIVGVTIDQLNKSATLIVVDDKFKYSQAYFKRTITNPTKFIYGAAPFNGRLHAAKMYIMEINNYYASYEIPFFQQEVEIMDRMHAVYSGRI